MNNFILMNPFLKVQNRKRAESGRRHGGMSFCSREQLKTIKTLQIPRIQTIFYTDMWTGRRTSLCVSGKGSMTVEASLILPFLLFAVTALLYLFSFTSVQARESRELTERAELLAITAGQARESDPYIRLFDADLIKLPFSSLFSGRKPVTRKVVVRAWVGYTGESFQNRAGETIVYITPTGSVYHKSRDCTHLRLSIRQIASQDLSGERNQSGSRYTPCIYCIREGWSGGTAYITDYGTGYHSSAGCQGLKRTVTAIPLSQAEGRHACSRCGRQ